MFKFDFTITISVIFALVALLSPIITALINNHHQLKMKRLEIQYQQKLKAVEKYLNSVGKYIVYDSVANQSDYIESKGLIYFHMNRSAWHLIDELDKAITARDTNKVNELLPRVCKELSKPVNNH